MSCGMGPSRSLLARFLTQGTQIINIKELLKLQRYRNPGTILLTAQTTGSASQAQQEYYQPDCCHLIACREEIC